MPDPKSAEEAQALLKAALESGEGANGQQTIQNQEADTKAASGADADTSGQTGKAVDKSAEAGGEGDKGSKKAKGVERILAQRNTANNRVKELESEVESLKSQSADADFDNDPTIENKGSDKDRPFTVADMEKHNAKLEAKAADSKDRDSLIAKFPKTAGVMDQVDAIIDKHPTLTDEQAVRLLDPSLIEEAAAPASPDSSIGGDSTRTPAALQNQNTDPKNMSQADRMKHLEDAESKGELANI